MAREIKLGCDKPQSNYVLTMGTITFSIFFLFESKKPSLKNCMLCLLVLSFTNIKKLFDGLKHLNVTNMLKKKKKRNQEEGKQFFTAAEKKRL